jgi:hypothetical protein
MKRISLFPKRSREYALGRKQTMRRTIDPRELPSPKLNEFVLVALAQLGCSATKEEYEPHMAEMLKDTLTDADRVLLCRQDGEQVLAPEGYTGHTWEAWQGKTSVSFVKSDREGLTERKDGVHKLTPKGLRYVALLAERWLKTTI